MQIAGIDIRGSITEIVSGKLVYLDIIFKFLNNYDRYPLITAEFQSNTHAFGVSKDSIDYCHVKTLLTIAPKKESEHEQ